MRFCFVLHNAAVRARKAAGTMAGRVVAGISARDAMLAAGLGLAGYGLSLVYWPAAFIAPGTVLTAIAVFGVR